MKMKDKNVGKLVDVCDKDCFKRPCYWPRPDPGVFTQGVGYRTRGGKQEWLCGRREINGCPHPLPELKSSSVEHTSGFNMKLHKKAEVDLKDRILKYKKALEIVRAKGDEKGEKALLIIIKKLIAEDSYSPIERVEKPDRGPVRTPGSRSPSLGLFHYDDERSR